MQYIAAILQVGKSNSCPISDYNMKNGDVFMFIPFMFIIASHAENLSFKLASLCVLCLLARDSRSKAGYSGIMSFVAGVDSLISTASLKIWSVHRLRLSE